MPLIPTLNKGSSLTGPLTAGCLLWDQANHKTTAKHVDAVEAHLKYRIHMMSSCILRKIWKRKKYLPFPNPKCTAYKVVWNPATPSWLRKVVFSCSYAFSSSTVPPASYKLLQTHIESLSEVLSETVRVPASGLN